MRTLYAVKPFRPLFGLKQWMRVLGELNDLGQQREQIIRDGVPKVTAH